MFSLERPGCTLRYRVDDYTDPWREPGAVLLLHGNAESSLAWYAWVPVLARHYRVVRPDMRGYGESTPMPRDHPWTLEELVEDGCAVMDALGIERFHLIGAKIGGTVARAFAARRPRRVRSLVVAGTPQARRPGGEQVERIVAELEAHGTAAWALRTMAGRLGSEFPDEGTRWWARYMGRAPVSSMVGFNRTVNYADVSDELPRIACPTLVITTEGSALGDVDRTRAWQASIPRSRLQVLPGDSYHVAVSHARPCAEAALAFMQAADASEAEAGEDPRP